jgi:hypothetical protein
MIFLLSLELSGQVIHFIWLDLARKQDFLFYKMEYMIVLKIYLKQLQQESFIRILAELIQMFKIFLEN